MPARGAATKASAAPTSEPAEKSEIPDISSWPLVKKLAWVMDKAGYVQKRGWNDYFKYKYVTEGDLVSEIRPLLAQAGIIIIPDVVEEARDQDVIQERGGMSSLVRVNIRYTVTDGKDSIVFHTPGYGADRGDKGIYKAMTGSMKYAIMKLFMVETGDDPERELAQTDATGTTVAITGSQEEGIGKGGKSQKISRYQLQRITATMREKNMDRSILLNIINDLFGAELVLPETPEDATTMVLLFLKELESEDAGKLIQALDEWSVRDGDA